MLVVDDPARAAVARAGGIAAVAGDAAARDLLVVRAERGVRERPPRRGPPGGHVSGRGPRRPGEPGDVTTIEVDDDDFDEFFEDAPATDPNVPSLAELDPEASVSAEPAVLFAPTLPEMEADIWQAGMEALVSVPEQALAGPPAPEEWRADAHLYRDESALAATPEEAAALLVAAGRAAEAAGDAVAAARGYDEALAAGTERRRGAAGPGAVGREPGRARRGARALGAARCGGRQRRGAGLLRRALGRMDAGAPRDFARRRRWTRSRLDRRGPSRWPRRRCARGRVRPPARWAPPGARSAPAATRPAGRPPRAPAAIGAAFIEQAARVALTARDANAAAAYLAAARRLAPAEPGIPLAALGGAARATGRDAEKKLAEVLPGLPAGSPVTEAVRRWGAGLARARGDLPAARAFLDDQPSGLAAARDCIELDVALGAPLSAAGAGAGPRRAPRSPAAAATLTWVEAESLRRQGDDARRVRAAGRRHRGGARRARRWRCSPKRRPPTRAIRQRGRWRSRPGCAGTTAGGPRRRCCWPRRAPQAGSELTARAALQTALEAAPTSAVFWEVAGEDARAGRRADASAVLAYGAEIWRGGALEAPLRACAAAKLAPARPGARAGSAGACPADGKLSAAGAGAGGRGGRSPGRAGRSAARR